MSDGKKNLSEKKPQSKRRNFYIGLSGLVVLFFFGLSYVFWFLSTLPSIESLKEYKPPTVSIVYDRMGKKIGEFFYQKRFVVNKFPDLLIKAFVAAEDSSFYSHKGLNFKAIFRALLVNLKAGRKVQGASTITQQVARSFLLTKEKTYTRKLREMLLSYRIEKEMKKDHILFLYLNQIYFGKGAYGVGAAAKVYFDKTLDDLSLAEIAILAGLPQAPSRYSPFKSPRKAKVRQKYVLKRMFEEGYITEEQRSEALNKIVSLHIERKDINNSGFFLEAVRQILSQEVGSNFLLTKGLHITTSLDLKHQKIARKEAVEGLRALDKRQGYRRPLQNLDDEKELQSFLKQQAENLYLKSLTKRKLQRDGTFEFLFKFEEKEQLASYFNIGDVVKGVVSEVNDSKKLVYVRFAENKGLISMENMEWARVPNFDKSYRFSKIKKPSEALKKGDVIQVKILSHKFKEKKNLTNFIELALEQEPVAQIALLSFDQRTQDITAMVGGYKFETSKFNRAYQALRQTGSSFKPIVYTSALDKGFKGNSKLQDIPLVYEEEVKTLSDQKNDLDKKKNLVNQNIKKWKPTNYYKGFSGEVTLRNALVRSLNIPTIRMISKLSSDWVAQYAYRLGIFNPLNKDYTLALGTSGTTLYEMTKVFSHLGRLGKKTRPLIVREVKDSEGKVLLKNISLDKLFESKIKLLDSVFELKRHLSLQFETVKKDQIKLEKFIEDHKKDFESFSFLDYKFNFFKTFQGNKEPPFYFRDKEQLLKPQTAYITTNLLEGVIRDPKGTGRGAQSFSHPAAGKTGTSSNFFDAWFLGYTAHYIAGVWLGFDKERSLGLREGGGRAALPVWLSYMKQVHKTLKPEPFAVPDGIIFMNIDGETGELFSHQSKHIVSQAFLETDDLPLKIKRNFLKEGKEEEKAVQMMETELKERGSKELHKLDLSE